jgi:hypothetical protein
MDAPLVTRLKLITIATGFTLATLGTAAAGAQEPASPDPQFAALAGQMRTGDSVTITDTAGAKIHGRLADFSPGQMTLLVGGERHAVAANSIQRVQRTRVGVLLGAIVGGGVGVVSGLALSSYASNEGFNGTTAFLIPVAIGLGAGIGVDALVNLPRTVYKRTPGTRVTVAPILAPGTRGGAVRISF